jgi:hypothetical protein
MKPLSVKALLFESQDRKPSKKNRAAICIHVYKKRGSHNLTPLFAFILESYKLQNLYFLLIILSQNFATFAKEE